MRWIKDRKSRENRLPHTLGSIDWLRTPPERTRRLGAPRRLPGVQLQSKFSGLELQLGQESLACTILNLKGGSFRMEGKDISLVDRLASHIGDVGFLAIIFLFLLSIIALGVFFLRTHWKTVTQNGDRQGQGWGFDSNRAIGLVLLVFAAVTLVLLGKEVDTTAAYTLLGTLAGYLFNKEPAKETTKTN